MANKNDDICFMQKIKFIPHLFREILLTDPPKNPRYVTDKRLRTVNFIADNIEKIIGSLTSNKAHGHGNISIRMLKICGDTICKPLESIFKQALTTGVFPSDWKKAILSLITKKATNKTLKIFYQFLYFSSAENF